MDRVPRTPAVFLLGICALLACKVRDQALSETPPARGRLSVPSLEFHIDPSGLRDVSYEKLRAVALAAAQAWTSDECRIPRILIGEPISNSTVRRDGQSMIIARGSVWARNGQPDQGYYPAEALALTTSYPDSDARGASSAEIDIELNLVHHRWGDARAADSGDRRDLQAGLTHEFGHALGLVDNCDPALPLGTRRQAIRPCAEVPAAFVEAAMYPVGAPGVTSQRKPSQSERRALCALYGGAPPG